MRRLHIGALAMGVVLALVLAAGCQQATSTPTTITFDTKGLMVAVVPALTEGAPMVPGLAFDSATRVLSGTPTTAGVYPLAYTATSGDDTATLNFTVEVVGSLIGSWALSGHWTEDDQVAWRWEQVLTFTKSRYIMHHAVYPAGSTILDHEWSNSGGWEYTPDTITRVWLDDHDDDDDTPLVQRSVRKDYYWVEGGRDMLCVHNWDWGDEDEGGPCEVYTRMPTPSAASLLGTWVGTDDDWKWTFTLTLTDFNVTIENIEDEDEGSFELTGPYEVVPEELWVVVTIADALVDGESILSDPDSPWKAGVWSRWAFAPTISPTTLVVSPHWEETNPNPDGSGFIDGADLPYGAYWLLVDKQP